jgi:hypothetical protein
MWACPTFYFLHNIPLRDEKWKNYDDKCRQNKPEAMLRISLPWYYLLANTVPCQKLRSKLQPKLPRLKAIFHCSRFARAGGANITQLSL